MTRFNSVSQTWPDPTPIPDGLLPVKTFDPDLLPASISPWALDIADRMQCPLDFIGISALAALGAVLGRKVAIRPKQKDCWACVANFWAMVIGKPGVMKSPAMEEAIKPLRRLPMKAAKTYAEAMKRFSGEAEFRELLKTEAKKKARRSKNPRAVIQEALSVELPEPPKARRYLSTDATYEKLGIILSENPLGTMIFRDELISLLRHLDKEEQAQAKSFFMTAWNGNDGYTFDRIVRGTTHIESVCLSVLGATQPGVLTDYIRGVHRAQRGCDGFIQRFGLLTWPNINPQWHHVDEWPDREARDNAWDVFEWLDQLTPESVKAEADRYHDVPFLRFDPNAQAVFNNWLAGLETLLRSGELTPALESHFGKYRKLIPALALINHLAEPGASGPVPEAAIRKAIRAAQYLETHARRVYASGMQNEATAAKAILTHIRKGDLKDGFTVRDVRRPQWSNLSDLEEIEAGLDLLSDYNWIAEKARKPGPAGGRPTKAFGINPACWR
jgi:hypothetical protein